MLRKLMIAASVASVLAMPAMAAEEKAADTCEAMLQKAAQAAAAAKLDEVAAKTVAELKAKAQEQMKAGDEEGCKATAAGLLKALGAE